MRVILLSHRRLQFAPFPAVFLQSFIKKEGRLCAPNFIESDSRGCKLDRGMDEGFMVKCGQVHPPPRGGQCVEVMAAVGSWCGGVSRLSLLPTHPSQADVQSRILDEATVEGRGDSMISTLFNLNEARLHLPIVLMSFGIK